MFVQGISWAICSSKKNICGPNTSICWPVDSYTSDTDKLEKLNCHFPFTYPCLYSCCILKVLTWAAQTSVSMSKVQHTTDDA